MSLAKYLSVSLVALSAGAASAGEFYDNGPTATLTQNGLEQYLPTSVNFPPTYNGSAGQFTGTYGTADGFLRFFCFEYQAAGAPTTYRLNADPPALTAAAYESLQRLYDLYYRTHGFNDFYEGGAATTFGIFDSNTDAAAFQLAVWEIVFGPALDAPPGNPYSAQATAMLNNLGSSTGYENWTVYTLTSPSEQDFVTATRNVAEPGSLALAGLALGAVGFFRRRRS